MSERQLSDVILDRLRTMIISNELRPGMKLVDRALARDLGVSRTPVREALGRLVEIGIVDNRERGFYVVNADSRRVADLYHLREILEVGSIQLAAANVQPTDIQELRDILLQIEKLQANPARKGEEVRLGLTIHQVLARSSGNRAIQQALDRLLDQMLTFVWMEVLNESEEASATSHREHRLIVDLVDTGRGQEAAEVIRVHLRSAREHVISVMRAREALFAPARASIPMEIVHHRASGPQINKGGSCV
ncbi:MULTISPECIES: GntR family transcriptional regulator [Rhizobium]|uniref:DNA-binding GntR family transcriptional regulator n=1 Tax=Rhizobium binae TaxID=1138190 RepID=A0ABV2MQG3_9HYPH|nr:MULTISPECIES: GntR family transcriptional regulator [Rhizobium]MBX4938152.1 GntR family transcriptional regulator [Rhizobium binae]MBX4945168.1 GntR family transcriptional regulator [Rhizobium binae]MBX4980374.1 GntR family transcriptional regulator [Rhizobium binae]MBX4995997.1 GntR family transcriptional regulator [Rhizobium binae]MBX5154167.1 GntR family transcriptional regulator [Rhizobium lentis]